MNRSLLDMSGLIAGFEQDDADGEAISTKPSGRRAKTLG